MRAYKISAWSSSSWTGTGWLKMKWSADLKLADGAVVKRYITGTRSWTVQENRLLNGINYESDNRMTQKHINTRDEDVSWFILLSSLVFKELESTGLIFVLVLNSLTWKQNSVLNLKFVRILVHDFRINRNSWYTRMEILKSTTQFKVGDQCTRYQNVFFVYSGCILLQSVN